MRISGIVGIALLCAGAAGARPLDLAVPEDGVLASKKIACGSLKADAIAYAVWKGKVFSRVNWEADRLLFDVVGYNVRRCPTVTDPQRGTGYRLVSREVMLFLEPGTDKVLEMWNNPFTGERVKVVPVANDPVNLPAVLPRSRDGTPYRFSGEVIGDWVVRNLQTPVFQPLPLGKDFAAAFGGHSQAIEVYTHFVPRTELLNDSEAPLKNMHLAWYRVGQWLPWMKMGERPGSLIFSTYGWRIKSLDDLPDILKRMLAMPEYALYREPPPADDTRPMADEYAYFERIMQTEEQRSNGR
jgi:hypothetical protein